MYPITENTAKALLPVAGRPVLDYLFDQLMELEGLEEIHIVVNNRFYPQFEDWMEENQSLFDINGLKLRLYNDGVNHNDERLGAIGDLQYVVNEGDLWGKPALILAGDNIFIFDLKPIWNQFVANQQNYILGIEENELEKLQRTGVIGVNGTGVVTSFVEKPEEPPSNLFCPPVYFLQPEAIALLNFYIDEARSLDAIGSFVGYVCSQTTVYAALVNGKRFDIGSMEDYEAANKILEDMEQKRK